MCGVCGCADHHETIIAHHHDEHIINIEQDIFALNNQYAELNKQYFQKNNILPLNIMSSPGSGKTTLLTRTLPQFDNCAVIVGDQHTDEDAKQLQTTGFTAIQVNTGKVCHLDAHMVNHAIEKLPKKQNMLLFIENIGNLVCPSLFNLGESYKIVLLSVTEGDNKPIKYPEMFRHADLLIITKSDLLPYVDFNVERCSQYAKRINQNIEIITTSIKDQHSLTSWYNWLKIIQNIDNINY